MADQGNRTFICSVVFVDLVAYTKKSVSEQIEIKDHFTQLLSEALVNIPQDQRLILDTGDGAAMSFLGDPEDALFVAMHLRDSMRKLAEQAVGVPDTANPDATAPYPISSMFGSLLRIGINLGPVKLVRDINDQPNIIGDGINVAQRIMSFAQPGQVVVSRSYYDVVSCLSEEYAKLFQYEGSRTDKHVREHEIYVVGDSDAAFNHAKAGMEGRASATGSYGGGNSVGTSTGGYGAHPAPEPEEFIDDAPLPFLQDRKKLMLVGGVFACAIVGLAVALGMKQPVAPPPVVVVPPPVVVAPPQLVKPVEPVVSTNVNGTADPTKADPNSPDVAAAKPDDKLDPKLDPKLTATKGDGKAGDLKTDAKADPNKADGKGESKAAQMASLKFSINPWGDVIVDGKSIGTSPPLKTFALAPGKHKIEIRNTTFTPRIILIELKPKEVFPLAHKFE
jgi:class 3 adenylate cyclase